MSQKSGKEFEVIVEPRRGQKKTVTLPIVAGSRSEAAELAEPIRVRRRLGPVVEIKEVRKKP